jgi:hypothetical protein
MASAAAVDRSVARIAARRLVEAASLRPPGLPPSALLCVRRLADPLPGALQLDVGALVPVDDWRRAAADALATQAREAARPALGPVPARAGAVLFADRAELLAALARDWLDGSLVTRWWWAVLLRTTLPGEREVARAWRDEPAAAPVALEQLAATSQAIPFAVRLPEHAALAIARAVAQTHALSDVAAVLGSDPDVTQRTASEAVSADTVPEEPRSDESVAPTWARVVPEAADEGLPAAARVFLAVALGIARAPAVVRTPAFAHALRRVLLGPAQPTGLAAHAASAVASAEAAARSTMTSPPPQPTPQGLRTETASARTFAPNRFEQESGANLPSSTPKRTVLNARIPPVQPQARRRREPSPLHAPPPSPAANGDEQLPLVAATRTELAGVFMLLNVALALGLYNDFTLNVERELTVDPWRLVSLAGGALLRGRQRRDPVWSLLESLADERPVRLPRDWRIPRAWLAPFEHEAPLRYSTARGRLRVEHPGGFAVLDVPLARNPLLQLARSGARDAVESTLDDERDWLAHFVAYLRARLALALAVSPPRVARTLLQCPGRVYVSAARVDVVMQLEHLAIEVRLAGLDRDPGWIPRARHDVRFHFE